jgi:hypothetical protein
MEEYKIIKNYENYEISNYGNLRNVKTKKILKTWECNGYEYCRIINNDGYKKITIHRLVALSFLENPNNLLEIDHINKIRNDNNIINLRWVTRKENANNKNIEKNPRKNNTSKNINIHKTKYNKYIFCHKNIYYGSFNNLDEAINKRKEILGF